MKNKTKIMLGLSVLTAGTLAAGATGTLAWFTTNKTASATYNNIKALGTQGNMKISIQSVTDGKMTGGAEGTDTTAEGVGSFTSDVSSKDGLIFAQPNWKKSAGNGFGIEYNSIENVTDRAGYFTQYLISIKNEGTADQNDGKESTVDIYLDSMTISNHAGSTVIADWTRVAINTEAKKEAGDSFLTVNSESNKTYLIQNSAAADGDKKYVAPIKSAGNMGTALTSCDVILTKDVNTSVGKIKESIGVGQTATIGVSVWMEGTLNGEQSQDTAKGQSVDVSMTFVAKAHANA